MALLGAYLTQAGRAQEAVDLLAPYVRREQPDLQVLTADALALAAVRRPSEALSMLAEARRQDPTSAMLRVDAGTVHLMAGDREAARREFEAAVSLNPEVARAHSSLGVIAAEDHRTDEAIAHWRQALTADPHEAATLLAFAEFLRRNGRGANAQPYLELFATSAPPQQFAGDIDRVRRSLAQRH
jgi:tetratricopeptide (TPR) repeat protein